MKKIFLTVLFIISTCICLSFAEELAIQKTQAEEAFTPLSAIKNYYVDPYTGSANFSIPIFMPPARKTLPQKLNLIYSSRAGNGWLGVGWKLDLAYIERSTKNGYPKYDSTDKFVFSLGQQQNDLVYVGGQEYKPKTADITWKFVFDGQRWIVKDNLGNTYYFGLDSYLNDYSRTKDSKNSGKVFRWRLSKITDPSGNNIIFKYLEDEIKIYYTEKNETAKSSYDEGNYNYLVEISFSGDRQDKLSNVRPDFEDNYPLNGSGRIGHIKILYREQLIKRYILEYEYSSISGRSMLTKITEYGVNNELTNPPLQFSYSKSRVQYDMVSYKEDYFFCNGLWRIRFADNITNTNVQGNIKLTPDGFINHKGVTFPLTWSKTYSQDSGDISGFSWSMAGGELLIKGKKEQAFHAWTYIALRIGDDGNKQYNVVSSSNCNAIYFLTDGISQKGPFSINQPISFGTLKKNETYVFRIDVLGYNFSEDFTLDYKLDKHLSFWEKIDSNSCISGPPKLAGDFNGDGITDIAANGEGITVGISNKRDFFPQKGWTENFPFYDNDSPCNNNLIGDFNGDGKTDLYGRGLCGDRALFRIALSTGYNFFKEGAWEDDRERVVAGDFNGDGLTDVCVLSTDSTGVYAEVAFCNIALRNNQAFQKQEKFRFDNINPEEYDNIYLGDFNGDGITDFSFWKNSSKTLEIRGYKNNWSSSIKIDESCLESSKYQFEFSRDFNFDGKIDLLYYNLSESGFYIKNLTDSRNQDSLKLDLKFRYLDTSPPGKEFIQTGDFNGDGIIDFLFYSIWYNTQIALSNGIDMPDLLIGVNNGWGANLEFQYRQSSEYRSTYGGNESNLPFTIPVISEVNLSDGLANIYKTSYVYSKGYYDTVSKEFRGFGYVLSTDNEDNFTETWFLQDDIYKGKISRQEISDKNANLFFTVQNTWANTSHYPDTYIVSLAETIQNTYDGGATSKQKKTQFKYDIYGNQISIKDYGDITIEGDKRETVTAYNYNAKDWLISCPYHIFTKDNKDKLVQEKYLYYDGSQNKTTPPVKGLLSKEEVLILNPLTQKSTQVITQYTYDVFGNPSIAIDSLGRITTTEFDLELHTYPAKIINALGQITKYTYDQRIGEVLTATDLNNQTTKNIYDALGRLTHVIGPDDTEDNPGVIYEYDFAVTPIKITKKLKTSYLSGQPDYLTTYSFYDGLGRLIQTKTTAENDPQDGSPRQIISNVVTYDYKGQIKDKYLPCFTSSSEFYSQDFDGKPKATFTYDCLGRLIQKNNPDGTYTQNIHSGWTMTSIDENGHKTTQTQDAYSRVVKTEEYNGSEVYTTIYQYNALGNLVQVTDNQGNNNYFVYDSLGRRLQVNDPDMGIWNYEYDLTGNLIKQIDARGQVITFEYDALNRIKSKKNDSKILAEYAYDDVAKQFCIGRLSKVTDPNGSSEFFYNNLGRQIKSIKTVAGSNSYTIERTYDALNRVISFKYPDGEVVAYTYNTQGIESVKGASAQGDVTYVSSVDYSPANQIIKIEYGNDVKTDYIYDPNTLRIRQILTQNGSGSKIQDLNYVFDNVGNIQNIQDYAHTASQDFLYDDLNRLIHAQGSYGSFTYTYDSIGNILSKEGINYAYGAPKPHAVSSTSDGASFEYDLNGNMVTRNYGQRTQQFIYDAENHLIRAEEAQNLNVKTIQIYLQPGINYISLPFGPSVDIKEIFSSIQNTREEIAYWDATQNKYLYNVNDLNFDEFATLEYAKGYWVYINNPQGVTLNIKVKLPEESRLTLKQGWNSVGCPKDSDTDIEEALKPLQRGVDYAAVARYNSDGSWQQYNGTRKDFTKLKPGEGYWIKMQRDTTWNINNTVSETSATEFLYDTQGNRVKKIAAGKSTAYIDSLFEKDSDGAMRKHIFIGSQRVATRQGLSPKGTVPEVIYYHSDHLGSSNVITDQSGNQAQLAEYTPFGSLMKGLSPQGTVPEGLVTSYLFTGKELDTTTGLYYYGARYYNPGLGKFIQPDPVIQDVYDPQNFNHYAYCRNNPLILTDPDGNAWGDTWSSWSSNWSSGWNSFSNWTYNSYQSSMQSLGQSWNNLTTFTYNSINTFTTYSMQTFSSIGSGLSSFGSGLGMGMNYGLGQLGQGIADFSRSQRDMYGFLGEQTKALKNSTLPSGDRWWPKWSENFPINYGNYCGPGNTDLNFVRKATTDLDMACMMHDWNWREKGAKYANLVFYNDLVNLPSNPFRWDKKPANIVDAIQAVAYKNIATEIFLWKSYFDQGD